MGDFKEIATQFVKFYYDTFDQNRANLGALYREMSMLTFEAAETQGAAAILEKLQNLPFQQVQHKIESLDAQPASPDGSIMVLVTGALMTEGQERGMSFTQTFQLKPEASTYYVFNDMFRLVYPAA